MLSYMTFDKENWWKRVSKWLTSRAAPNVNTKWWLINEKYKSSHHADYSFRAIMCDLAIYLILYCVSMFKTKYRIVPFHVRKTPKQRNAMMLSFINKHQHSIRSLLHFSACIYIHAELIASHFNLSLSLCISTAVSCIATIAQITKGNTFLG